MRENRPYGSEGGESGSTGLPYPYPCLGADGTAECACYLMLGADGTAECACYLMLGATCYASPRHDALLRYGVFRIGFPSTDPGRGCVGLPGLKTTRREVQ
jgi:hypothetical protein